MSLRASLWFSLIRLVVAQMGISRFNSNLDSFSSICDDSHRLAHQERYSACIAVDLGIFRIAAGGIFTRRELPQGTIPELHETSQTNYRAANRGDSHKCHRPTQLPA